MPEGTLNRDGVFPLAKKISALANRDFRHDTSSFALDGSNGAGMRLGVDEPCQSMALGKAVRRALSALPNAVTKECGDTEIQYAARLVGHYVNQASRVALCYRRPARRQGVDGQIKSGHDGLKGKESAMTRQELDAALARLGLDVPEKERDELVGAVAYIEKMAELVKKPRHVGAEPAHTIEFPKG